MIYEIIRKISKSNARLRRAKYQKTPLYCCKKCANIGQIGRPITKRQKLGLKKGDIAGVHSSLSSFGYVEGGADAVIDALLKVVGEEGTVVMPTYSDNREEVERTQR